MSIVTVDFTGVGTGLQLLVLNRRSFGYEVAGSFVGTVVLEKGILGNTVFSIVKTFTSPETGNIQVNNSDSSASYYRFRCTSFTSGEINTTLTNIAKLLFEDDANVGLFLNDGAPDQFSGTGTAGKGSLLIDYINSKVYKNEGTKETPTWTELGIAPATNLIIPGDTSPSQTTEGQAVWDTNDDLLTIGTGSGRKTYADTDSVQTLTNKTLNTFGYTYPNKEILVSGYSKVGATAGWVVGAANNLGTLATLPAGQTNSTLVVPLSGLQFAYAHTINAFFLLGQIDSAGNTATLDASLRRLTSTVSGVTDNLVASITQISVTSDTAIQNSNSQKTLVSPETIAEINTYYLLITGTTAAVTSIVLQGVVVLYTESFPVPGGF